MSARILVFTGLSSGFTIMGEGRHQNRQPANVRLPALGLHDAAQRASVLLGNFVGKGCTVENLKLKEREERLSKSWIAHLLVSDPCLEASLKKDSISSPKALLPSATLQIAKCKLEWCIAATPYPCCYNVPGYDSFYE